MSACEKCWSDACGDAEEYQRLLGQRVCSAEEQAGPDAGECPVCLRKTIHQWTAQAMCGCKPPRADDSPGHSAT
jgi:hypothetical protein